MKRKGLLSLFLTVSLIISTSSFGAIFVQADGLSVDQLYNNAYTAMQTAISTGKQADINTARTDISALNGTAASWAIGQFSQQVDSVQQPILVNIISAIDTAKATSTQTNVNKAKSAIPSDLTTDWKNAYSSAVDEIEQGIISDATNAYNTAITSKSTIDITNAEAKISDIMNSTDNNVVQWAKDYKTKIDDIVANSTTNMQIGKLEVTSTKLSLNTFGTTQAGTITYKVLDSNGNDITNTTLSNNLTFASSIGTVAGSDGVATFIATNANLAQSNSVVITIIASNGVSTSATLTANLTNTILSTLSDISLSTLTNSNGKVLTAGDNRDVFYLGYTATAINGNSTTNYKLIKQGLVLSGVNSDQLVTSIPYVTATLEQNPTDSSEAVIVVKATSDSIASDMPVEITAITLTGKDSMISITLKK